MLTGCSIWLHDSPALHDASLLISGGKIAAVGAEAQQAALLGPHAHLRPPQLVLAARPDVRGSTCVR